MTQQHKRSIQPASRVALNMSPMPNINVRLFLPMICKCLDRPPHVAIHHPPPPRCRRVVLGAAGYIQEPDHEKKKQGYEVNEGQ